MHNMYYILFFILWTMTQATHYDVLKIPQTASEREIRSAYLHLAKKLHPDKNFDENAAQQFKKLGSAYATLKDPVQRKAYDASLQSEFQDNDQEFCTCCKSVDIVPEQLFTFFFPCLGDINRS